MDLAKCEFCGHKCKVNRARSKGFCKASDQASVYSYGAHHGEEPPISIALNLQTDLHI